MNSKQTLLVTHLKAKQFVFSKSSAQGKKQRCFPKATEKF